MKLFLFLIKLKWREKKAWGDADPTVGRFARTPRPSAAPLRAATALDIALQCHPSLTSPSGDPDTHALADMRPKHDLHTPRTLASTSPRPPADVLPDVPTADTAPGAAIEPGYAPVAAAEGPIKTKPKLDDPLGPHCQLGATTEPAHATDHQAWLPSWSYSRVRIRLIKLLRAN